MAAILLDVDGVLHVSGEADPRLPPTRWHRLRRDGHRLRSLTNSTTRSRTQLVEQIRTWESRLDDEELQTTAAAAARALAGKRVLALTMHAIVGDLEGIELVGDGADAVLIGGADETPETNLVFSYMNLARAFAELAELGADSYCLPQPLVADEARAAARLGRLRRGARVRGADGGDGARQPSAAYYAAACEALDADPDLTWMVGDDFGGATSGALLCGLGSCSSARASSVPTSSSGRQRVLRGSSRRSRHLPDWLGEHSSGSAST